LLWLKDIQMILQYLHQNLSVIEPKHEEHFEQL